MVLYVFSIRDTGWLKMGYTSHCPWSRARDGYWKNLHPPECCGKLGWIDLELLLLAPGSLETEAAVKLALPAHTGEFWPGYQLESLRQAILAANGQQPFLSLPSRPASPAPGRGEEKLVCCGGTAHACTVCGHSFPRSIKLWQHIEDVHRCTRVQCACGKLVIPRNFKRHRESATCKRARVGDL